MHHAQYEKRGADARVVFLDVVCGCAKKGDGVGDGNVAQVENKGDGTRLFRYLWQTLSELLLNRLFNGLPCIDKGGGLGLKR